MCVLLACAWLAPVSAEPTIPEESLTLEQLVALSDKDLADVDIATLNLACAQGLPGSEGIDREALLDQLDAWARYVGYETKRHFYRFEQHPEEYNYSFGEFAMLLLTGTLQQDLGVRYEPEQAKAGSDPSKFDFTKSQDLFINGLLKGTGGTCPSMPVLYIAVGRRLGYPLKLVTTAEHSFLRWDDPKTGERFNIEGTSPGYGTPTDDHYRSFPREWSKIERETGNYLESLSPREELAVFLSTRADCLFFSGRLADAHRTYKTAANLSPRNFPAQFQLRQTQRLLASQQAPRKMATVLRRHEERRRNDPRLFIPGLPTVKSLSAGYRREIRPASIRPQPTTAPGGWGSAPSARLNSPFQRIKRGGGRRSTGAWQHRPPWRSAGMNPSMPGTANHSFQGYSSDELTHLADFNRPDALATYRLDPATLRTMSEEAAALQRELFDRSNPWYFVDANRKHRIGIHGPLAAAPDEQRKQPESNANNPNPGAKP